MPFAQIQIVEGRTEEQKRLLIRKVAQAIHEAIGVPKESIFVAIHELATTNCGQGGETLKDLGR